MFFVYNILFFSCKRRENKLIDDDPIDNYVMVPNNVVQHNPKINKSSYIQLYGKRTIAYLKQLIELQNLREDIHFSTDLILWMLKTEKNLVRERSYFKDFISELHKNSLINFLGGVDHASLSSSNFIVGNLNIYEYKEDDDKNKQKINYFLLMDWEYNLIMNEYSGSLDKYNLLNLFCNIKSRIRKNSADTHMANRWPEVAYPSYETIKNDIFIESDKTLKQYIDALGELDLMYFGYAGDMSMKVSGSPPIRRKSNFTYILSSPGWEEELKNSISAFKTKKRKDGWSFISKHDEISADEKRSITQKINMMEKKSEKATLTQSEKKDLAKLKRQQEKWNNKYDSDVDIRKLEEDKLRSENPNQELSEIYEDMGYEAKASRAAEEEKSVVVDNRHIAEIKGYGLQNKKSVNEVPVTVEEPDIFDHDSEDYSNGYDDMTAEEREESDAWDRKNDEQIPEEARRQSDEWSHNARMEMEDEMRNHMEDNVVIRKMSHSY